MRKLYRIPVLGYVVHLVISFFRMPRNDDRVRELRRDMRDLKHLALTGAPIPSASPEDTLSQHIPAFLNAVSTVPAMAHRLSETLARVAELERSYELAKAENTSEKLQSLLSRADELERRYELTKAANNSEKLQDLQDTLLELSDRLSTFEEHSGKQNSENEIAKIWERLEFVRREILYEMNHGRQFSGGSTAQQNVQASVINTEAVNLAKSQNELRLNIGCGHLPLDSHINVDMRALPHVDIVANADSIPLDGEIVDEIYSAHLVEHFPEETLLRKILPHWLHLLKPGGALTTICPDGQAMIDAVAKKEMSYEDFREVLFGAQDYDGDYHYNLLTPASLTKYLEKTGFTNVSVIESGRRNGKCFEFEVYAQRPRGQE